MLCFGATSPADKLQECQTEVLTQKSKALKLTHQPNPIF